MTIQATSSMAPSSQIAVQRSPWHSPVPYLFGGLVAMLGLVAFALLILACSYWNISPNDEGDLESGNHNHNEPSKPVKQKESPVLEEKYLVIMAGQVNPTFLATPISSPASSFGSCSCGGNSTVARDKSSMPDEEKESCDQLQISNMENHETV
ncbi:putative protein glutamine dumper [Helianthus annuus]|uniref:Glutamine dumper 3 n=1 Tax=Helianthus annuus TaxID=4232 RepID=A0A251ULF3_HELAN|nr:protein GLUTAMINE DUMPER 2 [Helianthus annuus]KAF5802683.1 putative protein glutamine dumper [Helianthus annuus]KAJ0560779.1 putative protein glutamine dumper [Helianthus annuus]KAJ0567206.1 putative protein glutamine dumper [Helianthus annuus]KAJ0573815.1 putative protein glutamine dumper [Helianthus annuus]KAJ0738150.1 putative protein glutamine dumper [Helianthus annuus]